MQDITTNYYNSNAKAFIDGTMAADVSDLRERFLNYIPKAGHILDWGCGSARDSLAFLERGLKVDAVDKSKELCELARLNLGIVVDNRDFLELEAVEKYDGIWACASLLHASREELPEIFRIAKRALKTNGVIYASFKYGDFEGERKERYFTDMTLEAFEQILPKINRIDDRYKLELKENWVTCDVRESRGNEKWLNLILKKMD
ncbi:class I SAM-dependent methyltransferase [Lachnospira pectinoschiza]|uniref:Methyltransferase domain-containing protein n=1 Tax=Lachnospira pectinoschiza TaxID=28052 RepID=A0A1G9TJC1_9FIRM|nr:class I SAM-dependent methyltransferase [Lachnospira pectinoschiza]SDM47638.1 Methyltransferase domain-containing protein [Lachnospira pectinoschiza]